MSGGAARTLSRAHALAAAPAAVAIVAGALGFAWLAVAPSGGAAVRDRYDREAAAALAVGDLDRARVCFERLVQLDPAEPRFRHGLRLASRNAP